MRFLLLTYLVLLTVCAVQGQDTINRLDAGGKKEGFWRKKDTAGATVYEGRFRNGVPEGEFRYFYPGGQLKTVLRYSENGRRASSVSYFTNGRKMAAGNYLDEKKDSIWQFFSEFDGSLVAEEEFRAGNRNGVSKVLFIEGGISEMTTYRDGVRDGAWEQYFTDGKPKLKGTFRNGEKDGQFRAWHVTGQLMVTGQYVNGHQEGTWAWFDEKGNLLRKEVYRAGLLQSTEPAPK